MQGDVTRPEAARQRLVDAPAIGLGHRADDALTSKTGALDHAFGRRIADVDVGRDAFDPEGEGVLGEEAREVVATPRRRACGRTK